MSEKYYDHKQFLAQQAPSFAEWEAIDQKL